MRIYRFLAIAFLALLSACTTVAPVATPEAAVTAVMPVEVASPTPAGTPTVTPDATATANAQSSLTETTSITATVAPTLMPTTTAPVTTSAITPLSTAVSTATTPPTEPATAPGAAITETTPMTTSVAMTTTTSALDDLPADTTTMTIGEILQSIGDFSVLAAAVNEAALSEALNDAGPYTLFAPTDEAFAVLPPAIRDTLLADPLLLTEILRYHIVADNATAARLTELGGAQSLSAQPLTITVAVNGDLQVNDAVIVRRDVGATNGTIHIINQILTPPGVALVIPPVPTEAIALADGSTAASSIEALIARDTSGQTVLEVLRSADQLSIAAAAIDSSGLSEALTQAGPFTVFIPLDSAFAELGADLETTLNNTQASADLIQSHLVLDDVTAAELVELGAVLTANGQTLEITVGADDGQIFINGAPVEQVDIAASNGVIHLLSAVIIPGQ